MSEIDEIGPTWLINKVERHDRDLYRGDDRKPGLVTRVELAEDFIRRTGANLSKIVWLLLGIFLTVLADLVTKVHL